jgi:hypothetical protein
MEFLTCVSGQPIGPILEDERRAVSLSFTDIYADLCNEGCSGRTKRGRTSIPMSNFRTLSQ